jgi:hypothetical protein
MQEIPSTIQKTIMKQEDFNEMRERVFARCKELTKSKGNDYTKGSVDVLKNFKENADEFGMTELQACGLYTKKHINAIFNYIKSDGAFESEPISERIVDGINYLIFLQALIEDKERGKK